MLPPLLSRRTGTLACFWHTLHLVGRDRCGVANHLHWPLVGRMHCPTVLINQKLEALESLETVSKPLLILVADA